MLNFETAVISMAFLTFIIVITVIIYHAVIDRTRGIIVLILLTVNLMLFITIIILLNTIMASLNVFSPQDDLPTKEEYEIYIVGQDIEAGIYSFTADDKSYPFRYVARCNSEDDIIEDELFISNGYVEIKDTDVLIKTQNVKLKKIDLSQHPVNIKQEFDSGMYLVGYDIAPGTYIFERTKSIIDAHYFERLSDFSMEINSVLDNKLLENENETREVIIEDSDFAIKITGGKFTLKE